MIDILKTRKYLKDRNYKLVVCTGCFDIFHIRHLEYLEAASRLGDFLLVGLDNDESVRQIKGKNRPINNEQDRLAILTSLKFVDLVLIHNNTRDFLNAIQPDIWCKGGGYTLETLDKEEVRVVLNNGGKIEIIPTKQDISSTNILNKLCQK